MLVFAFLLKPFTIPDTYKGKPITTINYEAVSSASLEEITMPSSITDIKSGAFTGSKIKRVYYKGSLANWCSIDFASNDASPFYNSNNISNDTQLYIGGELLTIVTIPNDISKINPSVFFNCSSIKEVIIPENIVSIGACAFNNCNSLTSVEIKAPNDWYYKTAGDNVKHAMDVTVMSDKKS